MLGAANRLCALARLEAVAPLHTKLSPKQRNRKRLPPSPVPAFCFPRRISTVSYSDVISDEHGLAEYVNLKEAWIKMNGQSRRKEEIWTSSSKSQLTTAPCTAQWQRRPEAPMIMYRDWTPANSMQPASVAAGWKYQSIYCHSCRLRHGFLDTLLGCTQRRWLNAPSS